MKCWMLVVLHAGACWRCQAQRAVALRWEARQAGVPVLFAAYQASRRPACIWACGRKTLAELVSLI